MEFSIQLDEYISGLTWSPDGKWLAASTASGLIVVLDASTGAETQYFRAHNAPIMQLAWSPDGARLLSSAQDGTAKLWNPLADKATVAGNAGTEKTIAELVTLECGANKTVWVENVAWAFDGAYFATAAGKIVRVWSCAEQHNTTTVRLVQSYEMFPRTVSALAWHPRLHELAAASYGGAKLFKIHEDKPSAELELNAPILTLCWSPDAAVLATGLQENAVHFWRAPFGNETASTMRGYPEKISHLAFDASSTYLATPSSRGIVVWNFLSGGPEGTRPIVIEAHFERVTQVQFQHRGQLLASSDESGLVVISDPIGTARPLKAEMYNQVISQLAWSPDDKRIAVGTEQGVVDVWQTQL